MSTTRIIQLNFTVPQAALDFTSEDYAFLAKQTTQFFGELIMVMIEKKKNPEPTPAPNKNEPVKH